MISRELASLVIENALSTGGDFAEIFLEDKYTNSISMIDGKIENALSGRDHGAGIRIFKGLRSVYAFTNDTGGRILFETAAKAASALKIPENKNNFYDGSNSKNISFTQHLVLHERINTNIHPILYTPSSVSALRKAEVVKMAFNAAKGYNAEIIQVSAGCGDADQRILIANSEGIFTEDRRIRTRLMVSAIAGDGNETQTGSESPGRSMGFEMFDTLDPAAYGREAARTAVTMLHAVSCPAGRFPVVIDRGFGGVIFHEACGHALEATSVAKGNSVFADKMGMQIASSKVTAIDDGTIPNYWGSINIDDEGNPARRNVLIESGFLRSFMVDRQNGRRMGAVPTGNGRRQSYRFAPTSRMTNTFIAPGTDTFDAMIASVEYGLYAKKMGGGSVNPVTGEFNFMVSEGYIIKDGKISHPVRGATLIGKGAEVLLNIDMVGSELDMGQGMCGSSSGSIPTNVGQPPIRVAVMTVGGRGE